MPLSDHEQRLLDEIEQALYDEDPKFAASVRSARRRRPSPRRALVLCIAGTILGLGLVLVGLVFALIALSVVGFVLVVGSVGTGVQVLRGRTGTVAASPDGAERGGSRSPAPRDGFRSRMENRIRRRFEEN